MRELNFDVKGQIIEKNPSCNFENIVSGTKGYLKATFNFDLEWKGYGKVAVFKKLLEEYPVILNNNSCIIPSEALDWDYFSVSVIGQKSGQRLVTNYVRVDQERGV